MSHIPKCFPPKGLLYIQNFERTNTKPFREVQCSRCYSKRWVGSSNVSAQEKSWRKAALKFLGHCEFRRRMKYWGSRWGEKKRLLKPLQKVLYFFYLENVVFIVRMTTNITTDTTWWMKSVRTEDCWRQTTTHFHDVMRKEQEELCWAQVTHISPSSVSF